MAALSSWFISVVVITLDFDYMIIFQQPRFEPGMDLFLHSRTLRRRDKNYIGNVLRTA